MVKFLLLLFSTFLLADFTITYRIDNKIIQTSYYKDSNHTLFKFKESSKTLQELIILDGKKYIKFKENGNDKVYEIAQKNSDSNISKTETFKYNILETQENGGYSFKTEKWIVKKGDKNETLIVSNDKKIYPKIEKMVYALKKILPAKNEKQATIFNMGNGYALIKSDNIEFLSYNEKPIDSALFKVEDKNRLKHIAQHFAKCSMHICCGLSKYIKPAIELNRYINNKSSIWKLLNVAKCSNNLENAILTNGDNYIVVELSNSTTGKIDKLEKDGIVAKNINIRKIDGNTLKSTYIKDIDTSIKDIKLPNKTITIYSKGEIDLDTISKELLHIN